MKERQEHLLHEKTRSIWPYLLENKALFENPLYNRETRNHVLIPTPSVLKLVFWSRLYAKYDPRTSDDQLLHWAVQKKKQMNDTTL